MVAPRLDERRAMFRRPGFLLAALLLCPITLAVLGCAFFGIGAVVNTFTFPLVWFCYFLALLSFVAFTALLVRQGARPSQRSLLVLFIANAVCLMLIAGAYKALQFSPQVDGLPNLVFPVVFIPLSTLNGY
jgi:hypothetical protein